VSSGKPGDLGKLYFEASDIETIDKSVFNYLSSLSLFTTTNQGWKKVPVIWATAERAFLSKDNKEIRDNLGALIFPIISVKRTSFKKDLKSPGAFQGNVPEVDDAQGGSMEVSRVIYQEKTMKFANADALRLNGQSNFPRQNAKVVYRTISAPMPVNVEVMYEITLRTEYQQQMNDLMLPFITKPGTINFVRLTEGDHHYEGFIQSDYQSQNNLSDYTSQERKFETKISLKVVGYLVGQADNREKSHFAVRENAVEVKIPRERISLQEIPDHEFGRYYGLAGISPRQVQQLAPFASFFSNVPAIGTSAGTGTETGGSDHDHLGTVVTSENFAVYMSNNIVIREMLKEAGSEVLIGTTQVTVAGDVRENTESLFLNGLIMAVGATNDYTISGNVITLAAEFALEAADSLYVTYISG